MLSIFIDLSIALVIFTYTFSVILYSTRTSVNIMMIHSRIVLQTKPYVSYLKSISASVHVYVRAQNCKLDFNGVAHYEAHLDAIPHFRCTNLKCTLTRTKVFAT